MCGEQCRHFYQTLISSCILIRNPSPIKRIEREREAEKEFEQAERASERCVSAKLDGRTFKENNFPKENYIRRCKY